MESVNPLFLSIAGSFVRWALTLAAAWLVQHGVWTQNDSTGYVTGLTLAIVMLLWSAWHKYKSRLKFLTALEAPAGTDEKKVNAKVAEGMGAKVLVLVLAVTMGAGLLAGCVKAPPDLDPQAAVAFEAARVVKGLDVVRDGAIAAEDMDLLTRNDAREVVLWHKAVVQVIQVSPQGWRPIVKQSAYVATCDARLAPAPDPSCVPRLPQAALRQLEPYFGLVVLIILEVQ